MKLPKVFQKFASAFRRGGAPVDLPELSKAEVAEISAKATAKEVRAANVEEYVADLGKGIDDRRQLLEEINLLGASRGKRLGGGNFGDVHLVHQADPDAPPLVIKTAKVGAQESLDNEAAMMAKVGAHPNIVACVGKSEVTNEYGDLQEGLVYEFIDGGEMTEALSNIDALFRGDKAALKKAGLTKPLSQAQYMGLMQHMAAEITNGLVHLELREVVHNDIRPDNVMVDRKTGAVKIVDFGNAFQAHQRDVNQKVPIGTGTVSPDIMAGSDVGTKHDTFSVGATIFRQNERAYYGYGNTPDAKGRRPRNADQFAAMERIHDEGEEGTAPDAIRLVPEARSPQGSVVPQRAPGQATGPKTAYVDFMNRIMTADPSLRMSATQALSHPFLADRLLGKEEAAKLLRICMGEQAERSPTPAENDAPPPMARPRPAPGGTAPAASEDTGEARYQQTPRVVRGGQPGDDTTGSVDDPVGPEDDQRDAVSPDRAGGARQGTSSGSAESRQADGGVHDDRSSETDGDIHDSGTIEEESDYGPTPVTGSSSPTDEPLYGNRPQAGGAQAGRAGRGDEPVSSPEEAFRAEDIVYENEPSSATDHLYENEPVEEDEVEYEPTPVTDPSNREEPLYGNRPQQEEPRYANRPGS